jgi:hypothetical protein
MHIYTSYLVEIDTVHKICFHSYICWFYKLSKRDADFSNVLGYKNGYFCVGIKTLFSHTITEQLTRQG